MRASLLPVHTRGSRPSSFARSQPCPQHAVSVLPCARERGAALHAEKKENKRALLYRCAAGAASLDRACRSREQDWPPLQMQKISAQVSLKLPFAFSIESERP